MKNNFDFLRFALASLVLFGHSYSLLGAGSDSLTRAMHEQVFCGTVAVYGFFTISGFLITQSWQHSQNPASYFQKRILRIYPGFLMAAFLCAVVFSPLGADNYHHYFALLFEPGQMLRTLKSALLLKVLDLPGSFIHQVYPEVNGSIWTIQYEFMCYVLVAFFGVSGFFRRRWVVCGLAALAFVFFWADSLRPFEWLQRFAFPHALLMPLKNLPQFLVYFLAGMLLALFREHIKFPLWAIMLSSLMLIGAIFVPRGMLFLLPFAGPYLLLAFAYSQKINLVNWGKSGDLSYGLYLYAWPMQQLVIHYLPAARHPLAVFTIAFISTCGVAKFSWRFVESPFLKYKIRHASLPAIPIEVVQG